MEHNAGSENPSWAELLGSNHWSGLLDYSLRCLLLKFGDLCQVTTDSFITARDSKKYSCNCSYSMDRLLGKTFFTYAADYHVVQCLIAKSQGWMGYVAVSNRAHADGSGVREIYVVWRGTEGKKEWPDHISKTLVPFDDSTSDVAMVMQGWLEFYTGVPDVQTKESAREQLLAKIKELVEQYKDESLSIVCLGHSLGGALAILSAYDIVRSGLSKIGDKEEFPVCTMGFGSPRVGNQAFSDRCAKLPNLRALRVLNKDDLDFPNFPPASDGYVDIGTVLTVDSGKSPCLEAKHDRHNLQVVLHTVAGWTGENGDFDCTIVKRSLALVNKHGGYLSIKPALQSWWAEKNKRMVRREDGQWYELPPES
ncbi:phosphatidylcholine 1-acylhydrolase [Musa troglodytarum]|uniref:Phospholipase A1 n=1 Tax=Musa troglodytarum TaxID=320322 RepID=A0A9E7JNS0_9LILI|nr:phosphatidylcholine 1-acylhydrolase [Musa troglodytarum]